MQTRFNVGDEVLIKARVHSIKVYNDHNGNLKEIYFLDIPGSSLNNLLQLNESHITIKDEIVNEMTNKAMVKALESDVSAYPKVLNCCCDVNPKGGV